MRTNSVSYVYTQFKLHSSHLTPPQYGPELLPTLNHNIEFVATHYDNGITTRNNYTTDWTPISSDIAYQEDVCNFPFCIEADVQVASCLPPFPRANPRD